MKFCDLFKDIEYTTEDIVENIDICDVVYDSRKVRKNCVFVCLSGSNIDGHKFAKQAEDKGACLIVAQNDVDVDNIPVVKVKDTRYTLALLSANFFDHPAKKLKVIGITGTKGKTTTTFMIKSILEKSGAKVGVIGTIGVLTDEKLIKTENTTPESYEIQYHMHEMLKCGCQYVIMEVSSLGLKWHRVAGILFDIGVFTNFSLDHVGENEHKTLEEYKKCKAMLFKTCKIGVLNLDDKNYKYMIDKATCEIKTFGFSENADFIIYNDKLLFTPGCLGVEFDLKEKNKTKHYEVSVPGRFSAYNAACAIAVCNVLRIQNTFIKSGLKNIKVKGRVEILPVNGNYTLLIDYAHNAVSMENILTTLREYKPNRLICLFGAGGNRAKSRRYEMGEVCGKLADLSIITADNSRFENVLDIIKDIQVGMKKVQGKNIVVPDRKQAIEYAISNAQENDIIVLAGKGHEDYLEVNGIKKHFDEREIVAEILNTKR